MKVTPPVTVTAAMLTSSTVAEPAAGETAWSSGTYAVGDERIVVAQHRKYQCILAGSSTTSPELDATRWTDIGPTNRWAMFDLLRNSATTATSTMSVVLTPGQRIDSIGLVGLQASSVTVTVKVGATVYYTRTITAIQRNTVSWYTYLTGAFRYLPSFVLYDLPPITGCTITLDFTGSAIQCGGVVMGRAVDMGKVVGEPVSGATNYSRVERDTFGNITLVQRRSVPKTSQKLLVPKDQVDALRALRSDLNAVPALWSGLDDKASDGYFESLLVFGIYKTFDIPLTHTYNATVNLELEEM